MAELSNLNGQPNNPLSKKLNKILDTRLDSDKDVLEALKSLSTFFGENNIRTRRNLRSDIERRSLVINDEFVESFKQVKEQLDSVYSDVQSMNDCCRDMTSRLKNAKEQTHDLINQTTKLQGESQKLQLRAQVANSFLAKFQLKPEEVQILRGTRDGILHPEFFAMLARVKQIHTDCKLLLRTNQQTAGLEIMESMALHLESGYERLYRWTQNSCCLLTGDQPDVSNKLCQAVESLQDRPVLFKYALDEFSTARRAAVVRCFIDALTRGGPGGMPRPIELHSHDPLRYLGDMLAWLHQAAASEHEHIQALLKNCSKISTDDFVHESLGHITEGICSPLKVRVEQVLMSEPGSVILYKLSSLIRFYHSTLGHILPTGATLMYTLDEMCMLSLRMFFNSLSLHGNRILSQVELPPGDLGAPTLLNKTLQLLQEILSSHDSSTITPEEKRPAVAQILTAVVEPLVKMCSVSASHLITVDMATYMINCLHLIQTTLTLYEFTEQHLEALQAQIDAHTDTLVSEQTSLVLNSCGLSRVYNAVQQHAANKGSLTEIPEMDATSIKAVMMKFDAYLASPDCLSLQQFARLRATKVREAVKKQSVELICQVYGHVYGAMSSTSSGYQDISSIIPRTPDQVLKLLS